MLKRQVGAGLGVMFFGLLASTIGLADGPATPKTAARLKTGQPVRVVCFGDSVTGVYYHTGSRRAYTDMLGIALRRLQPEADVTTINAGISGHTTVNGLARMDKDVLAHEPTLVTVMFGLNDMTRVPLEQYRDNLKTIVARCRSGGAEVLLCTPNNVITSSGRPTEKLIQYCDVVRAVGRELEVPVCDCYHRLDTLRQQDALAWRMLMSDAIHPNMDGHQRIAELLAESITGRAISVSDVPPPTPALIRTLARVKQKQTVNVLAMTPIDALMRSALGQLGGDLDINVTPWDVAGKTLAEIEVDAKSRVRAMKPDLVVIAVPRTASAETQEAFIHSYAWIMNWSLNFGPGGWDCLVVHASVTDPAGADRTRDALTRRLVHAQDLHLIDRAANDARQALDLLAEWFKQQQR